MKRNLLVVAIMEGTIGNTQESFGLGVVAILAITFQKSQCCQEISLLQEMGRVWQFHLFLVKEIQRVSNHVDIVYHSHVGILTVFC